MPSLTLEDIAKQTGVSRSTVSRVMNNHPNVREDVRKRVLETIRQTGYHPNAAARTLASQRSWVIGLVLPHSVSFFFTDPYFPHLTKGIAQACNQHNYTLALFLVGTKEDEEKIYPRVTRRGLLDGVIVQASHHGDQKIIGYLVDAKMPLVVAGRPFRSDNVSYIDIDNVNSSYNAVSHLVRLGYKRIGTITGPANSAAGIDRRDGYSKALTERGAILDENLLVEGDFTEMGGYYAMQKLILAKPDAVFAASDTMAIGAMRAARDAGLKIPEDVALVGFDDLPLATLSDIQLTTVRQPVIQFGVNVVELLIDLIENGISPPRHIIMNTELIIRNSCGASRKK
jgi:LacI family transcriptional regulator